jgi:NTP pyrophosphatase (non-canonical NTP hydrolase)
MTEHLSINIDGGKYTVTTGDRGLEIQRYGQPWLVGHSTPAASLIIAMAYELAELRARVSAANDGAPDRSELAAGIERLVGACHGASVRAGWWRHAPTGLDLARVVRAPQGPFEELLAGALVAQKLCLTHSEVSEAMEGDRKGLQDDKLPSRPMMEVELADAVIRIADLAGVKGYDLGGAIVEKMAFNAQRPDHKAEHRAAAGGKRY